MPRCDGIIITGGLHLGIWGYRRIISVKRCAGCGREREKEGEGNGKACRVMVTGGVLISARGRSRFVSCKGTLENGNHLFQHCVMPMPPSAAPRLGLLPCARVLTGWVPKRKQALCGKTGRSPQSTLWKRACCVPPWAEQRGRNGSSMGQAAAWSNTKLLQAVFGQGSSSSLARASAAATTFGCSSRPTIAAAQWPVRFWGLCQPTNSGGT